MEIRIGARYKGGHLTSETKKPDPADLRREAWITENHIVKRSLIDSMTPPLTQWFTQLPTATEIWEAVARTFYDGSDETWIFELNQKSFFYKIEWSAITHNLQWTNSHLSRDRLPNPVTGRNSRRHGSTSLSHDKASGAHLPQWSGPSVWPGLGGGILRKDPKLELDNAYAYVRREHQQLQVMGGGTKVGQSWRRRRESPPSWTHFRRVNDGGAQVSRDWFVPLRILVV